MLLRKFIQPNGSVAYALRCELQGLVYCDMWQPSITIDANSRKQRLAYVYENEIYLRTGDTVHTTAATWESDKNNWEKRELLDSVYSKEEIDKLFVPYTGVATGADKLNDLTADEIVARSQQGLSPFHIHPYVTINGSTAMSGTLVTANSQHHNHSKSAINLRSSSIVGLHSLVFALPNNGKAQSILFPKTGKSGSSSNLDDFNALRAIDGSLLFDDFEVFHKGRLPNNADVGLNHIRNYPFSTDVNNHSKTAYASAFMAAEAYALAESKLDQDDAKSLYLSIGATAKNSDKLGGILASGYSQTNHSHNNNDIGLGNVQNWSATSSVNDGSTSKYATASAAKMAYDRGVSGETNAKKYADGLISELMGGNPAEHLDTIKELGAALNESGSAIGAINDDLAKKATIINLNAHKDDRKNPHQVTKAQVELGNVPNYPITSSATDNSHYKFASAAAVNSAYQLAQSKQTQAQADARYAYKNLGKTCYKDIHVEGDADTFYPVIIGVMASNGFGMKRVNISRGYNWSAPAWHTASHKGGCTLSFLWSGDSGWGGNTHNILIDEYSNQYTTVLGGISYSTSGMVVWLRGGGAHYRVNSEWGDATPADIKLSGFTAANGVVYSPRNKSEADAANVKALAHWAVRNGAVYDNNQRVYSPHNKPSWDDVSGNNYLIEHGSHLQIGANKWVRAAHDNVGFIPANPATGSSSKSYLGTGGWWFKEAWVNHYRGGHVTVDGYIKNKGVCLNYSSTYGSEIAPVNGRDDVQWGERLHFNGGKWRIKNHPIFHEGNLPTAQQLNVAPVNTDMGSNSLFWSGDKSRQGLYWGSMYKDDAAHNGSWAYIRALGQGQLEIGSDMLINIYETDARTLAVQINTNDRTLDAKGGLKENGTNLSSKYLGITAKATDADKLDGLNSSDFARSSHSHDGADSGMPLYTIVKTLDMSTSWIDTGINAGEVPSGSYMVQVSGMSASATGTYHEIFTGVMSWYAPDTNSNDMDEVVLHKAGHAANTRHIYLRTVRQQRGRGGLKLQIKCNLNIATTPVTFKFRKLI